MQGDGTISGALAAQPGMKQQTYVMASAHTNAEIGEGGVAPSLMAHAEKQPPVLAMATTCSPRSAQPMGASSSSTTRACEVDVSCSTQDRRAFNDCVASNGEDVVGALCARYYKGVGSQFVGEGKVIACRTSTDSAQASQ